MLYCASVSQSDNIIYRQVQTFNKIIRLSNLLNRLNYVILHIRHQISFSNLKDQKRFFAKWENVTVKTTGHINIYMHITHAHTLT